MKVFKLTEKNGWERETWNWYIDTKWLKSYKGYFESLMDRISKIDFGVSIGGTNEFILSFEEIDLDTINLKDKSTSYFNKNNLIEGRLNDKVFLLLLHANDRYFENFMYKGGIRDLFKNS